LFRARVGWSGVCVIFGRFGLRGYDQVGFCLGVVGCFQVCGGFWFSIAPEVLSCFRFLCFSGLFLVDLGVLRVWICFLYCVGVCLISVVCGICWG